jgi:succinate dehydrogenase subunit C
MTVGTELRPAPYRRRMSTWWWTQRGSYFAFVLRELSCVFVAWFVVFLLLLVRAVSRGQLSYESFLDWAATPWVIALNVVAFLFLIYHAITWINLTPKAMVVRLPRRDRQIPSGAILAQAYGGWIVVTAVVAFLLLRG